MRPYEMEQKSAETELGGGELLRTIPYFIINNNEVNFFEYASHFTSKILAMGLALETCKYLFLCYNL